jgi:hypothetical protein
MSGWARIESIETLKELRVFLCNFARKLSAAVDEAESDVLRTLNWLANDRYPYWKKELRIRNEQLVKAKLDLKRKQSFERAMGNQSSCVDEKKAFAAAQRRFDEAQDKLNKARNWIPMLEKESYACKGALRGLTNFVSINLPNTTTQIDEMIYALESYVNVATPSITASAGVEEMSAYSKTADLNLPPLTDAEKLCRLLRRRKPLKDLTSQLAPAKLSLDQFDHLTISGEILKVLKKYKNVATSLSENNKLIFERSVTNSDYIYFENFSPSSDTETKWYLGPVEPNETADYSACKISDFLKNYPDMEKILSLPAGWLVILKNKQLQAVFNADNKQVVNISAIEQE